MTHLEILQRGLAIVQAKNNGEGSPFERDLKAQIAAAKEAMSPLPHGETQWFGNVRPKSADNNIVSKTKKEK